MSTLDIETDRPWADFIEDHQADFADLSPQLLMEVAEFAEGEMRDVIMERLAGNPSGAMARSVTTEALEGTLDEPLALIIGATVPYARIQDEGGDVLPKRKYLAIPLKGTPKGKWPRDWPEDALQFIKRKGKSPLLAVVGPGGVFDPKYVLKTQVTLPGVRYVSETESRVAAEMPNILKRLADRKGAGNGS